MINDNGVDINTEIIASAEILTSIETGGEINITLDKIVAWDMVYGKPSFLDGFDINSMSYYHVQTTPSSIWTINHNMGKIGASVTIIDSANRVAFGDVTIIDINSVQVEFSSPFSGKAYVV